MDFHQYEDIRVHQEQLLLVTIFYKHRIHLVYHQCIYVITLWLERL